MPNPPSKREGRGTFLLNDVPHRCQRGGTIFIPKNTWHGFANPDQEMVLLWIMAPRGWMVFFAKPVVHPVNLEEN
jgi:quercetin dioxygenase-like cupin family protein